MKKILFFLVFSLGSITMITGSNKYSFFKGAIRKQTFDHNKDYLYLTSEVRNLVDLIDMQNKIEFLKNLPEKYKMSYEEKNELQEITSKYKENIKQTIRKEIGKKEYPKIVGLLILNLKNNIEQFKKTLELNDFIQENLGSKIIQNFPKESRILLEKLVLMFTKTSNCSKTLSCKSLRKKCLNKIISQGLLSELHSDSGPFTKKESNLIMKEIEKIKDPKTTENVKNMLKKPLLEDSDYKIINNFMKEREKLKKSSEKKYITQTKL